jgi:phosphoenolpyruvate synthase/pyruvate phosphate dikinase
MKQIKGIPASSGIYKGTISILKSLDEIYKFNQGDILVTEATSPSWTPVMQLAGAIVTDMGGMLSHAAIVSRELGIPAVVGTKTATTELKDGDMVEIDGVKGFITVKDNKSI